MRTILKKITPDFVLAQWRKYQASREKHKLNKLRRNIITYLNNVPLEVLTDEKKEVLDYLKQHPLSIFPYSYTEKYSPESVIVYVDNEKEMRYVLQDGKRLYFKKGWTEEQVQVYYNGLLIEQDAASPHRYETSEFHVSEGDVVVDIGVAEGNFALSVVEKVKKLYVFEVDEKWIEAIKATFATWKEKVIIVNKYVSDNDNNGCVTLDNFFANEKIDFIKIDVDGEEASLLAGAKTILTRQAPVKIAICTYHKQNDAEIFNKIMIDKEFHTEFSNGYMIFWYDTHYSKCTPPYLRRGLIRARKIKKN
jgi:2-polyprenyl-3-methyl-5-hydroxy-6-metoxy-1,4-benzoquinol methylase